MQFLGEKLHRLLIDDHLNKIIQEESFTIFSKLLKNFKNSVNNIITTINKYSKEHIENIEIFLFLKLIIINMTIKYKLIDYILIISYLK